jgi:hypothetical protein
VASLSHSGAGQALRHTGVAGNTRANYDPGICLRELSVQLRPARGAWSVTPFERDLLIRDVEVVVGLRSCNKPDEGSRIRPCLPAHLDKRS